MAGFFYALPVLLTARSGATLAKFAIVQRETNTREGVKKYRKEERCMSDQVKTGRAKRTGGSINISTKGADDIVKRLRKLENGGEVAIKRTVSDFTSRAPAWVSKGIREHYAVDAGAIKDAATRPRRGKTTINVAGVKVDGATLEYKGRTLTLTHFKMSPKQRPTALQSKQIRVPGQAVETAQDSPVAMIRPPKKYKVKATIIKGQRITTGPTTFINEGNGGVALPFQRTGEGRTPLEVVRTLSVPQMIDGRARETIESMIGEKLGERFEHHIKQITK